MSLERKGAKEILKMERKRMSAEMLDLNFHSKKGGIFIDSEPQLDKSLFVFCIGKIAPAAEFWDCALGQGV